jgi:hypothetical protein
MYERTWRPTVGGLLAIMAGAWNLLLGLSAIIIGSFFEDLLTGIGGITIDLVTGVGITGGPALIVLGLVAIVGGAFALSRRFWPMTLAGSIAAAIPTPLFLPFILGAFSLIFNVLGHKEFWGPAQIQKDIASHIEHARAKTI